MSVEGRRLLSQEDSPGWFQSDHSYWRRLWNHPSRDPLRDPAALLTQEGNFPDLKIAGFLQVLDPMVVFAP
jgi:hypothetical protein